MVSLSQFLILTLLLFSTPLFLFFRRRRRAPASRRTPPPSPPKLPVIGNLHQLGIFPHRSLQSLSRRYGPLMLLHFGGVPVVVASSAEAAREIMKNQDLTFSNRPVQNIPGRLLYNGKDVGFAAYGDHWRQARSICVLQLLSNKRVQLHRRVREEETSIMLERIMHSSSSSSSSTAVDLTDLFKSLSNDVMFRIALGKKYGGGERNRNFKELMAELNDLMGISPLWEYIPWLSWSRSFDGVDQRVDRVARAFDSFLDSVIHEHRERVMREKEKGDGLDFLDILLQFQRENQSSSPIEDDAIKGIIMDMFVAGTDTTITPIEWAMAELIKSPRTLRILQNEVREVIGSKGKVEEEDLGKMPYLKAVMKESLRLHAPVPLLLPRESTQDTKVLGYDIASGTRVVINAWAIARDPSLWENPEEFYPERFLKTSIDYRGLHFELIPFGAGRRGCPGITFAVVLNELALAKLVHKFDFKLPNGGIEEELDVSEAFGITIHRKLPLLVIATLHAS